MGSLAVQAFASEHDDCMDMLIVCGSPSENKARILGEMIALAEGKDPGISSQESYPGNAFLRSLRVEIQKRGKQNAWTCSDPSVYQAYADSELCGFTFTDDAYLALFELMKKAYDVHKWNCKIQECRFFLSAEQRIPALAMSVNLPVRSMR